MFCPLTVLLAYADIATPQQGPLQAHQKVPLGYAKNVPTGFLEDQVIDDHVFNEQFHTFHSYGYAIDPAAQNRIVGDKANLKEHEGIKVVGNVVPKCILQANQCMINKRRGSEKQGKKEETLEVAPFLARGLLLQQKSQRQGLQKI